MICNHGEDKSIIVRSAEDNDDDVRGRWKRGGENMWHHKKGSEIIMTRVVGTQVTGWLDRVVAAKANATVAVAFAKVISKC